MRLSLPERLRFWRRAPVVPVVRLAGVIGGDANGVKALVLATIANAIERLELREGITHAATTTTFDSAQPCTSPTLLSQIRDEVLRTIRAEAVFEAAATIDAESGSSKILNDYRMASPNKARADLLSAATWCRAETPQEALFQLTVISEILERNIEGDASDQDRISDGVNRMLHSVANVIETLVPGATLERDGLGFFFLSRRCDVLRALRAVMTSAPPVADE